MTDLRAIEAAAAFGGTTKPGKFRRRRWQAGSARSDRLADDVAHPGKRRGHWQSSPEIGSAMLERGGG